MDDDDKKDQANNEASTSKHTKKTSDNESAERSIPLETDTPLGDPGQIYETSSSGKPSSHEQHNESDFDPWTQSLDAERQSASSRQAFGTTEASSQPHTQQPQQKPEFMNSKNEKPDLSENDWDRDLINRLAFASLNEQRRARRWSIFFKILVFVYIGVILFYFPTDFGKKSITGGKHTALIDVKGAIAADGDANADNIVGGLRAAFENKSTAAVILRINSPGGSPVQAGYVYDEIKRLRAKHEAIKLYAVITDMCASGGYYIAAAADEIYADKASIVGSIGVLMNGFGFVDAMEKMGIERRLLTAGENKGVLDPFSPIKKEHVTHMQTLLDGVHKQFINMVKQGRGERLQEDPKLFSGLFWNGEEGLELGLVDGLGSSSYVAREIVGVEKLVDFTARSNYLDRFADRLGATFAKALSATLGLQTLGVE